MPFQAGSSEISNHNQLREKQEWSIYKNTVWSIIQTILHLHLSAIEALTAKG